MPRPTPGCHALTYFWVSYHVLFLGVMLCPEGSYDVLAGRPVLGLDYSGPIDEKISKSSETAHVT